ncbi:MAG: Holliday junction resolvase RuvX [Longimicrobiales bacterium]|nr:Holliday junction resolvase RuvX [Longimicrobiales bacterium]
MRSLGIDLGEKRIGISISDPTGLIAQPLLTLQRRIGKRFPMSSLASIIEKYEVEDIILGLPLALSGKDTAWTLTVRNFGVTLENHFKLPVHLVDERFTSSRAERIINTSTLPKKKRRDKKLIDTIAAVLILQGWLDSQQTR